MSNAYDTKISKSNLDRIRNRNMSPSEIIDFLENGAIYRSFPDVLRSVYPEEDLARILREGLAAQSEQPLTPKEADSLRHTISNWMGGQLRSAVQRAAVPDLFCPFTGRKPDQPCSGQRL